MAVTGRAIASQRGDSRQGTGLRLHITGGRTGIHAVLQCSVKASHRERRNKNIVDSAITPSIAQQPHLQFCRYIIIEREARAIGNLIVAWAQTHLLNHPLYLIGRLLGFGRTIAAISRNLVEQRLSVKIVALLHHRLQQFAETVAATADKRLCALGCSCIDDDHTVALQFLRKQFREIVLAVIEQGRQHGIVIVPAPTFTQAVIILERHIR